MYPGSVYNISAWVMLVPTDGSNHVINMSLQTTLDGNTSYPSVTRYPGITVPADGNWHQISVHGLHHGEQLRSGRGVPLLPDRAGIGQRPGVVLHRRLPAHLCSAADDSDGNSVDLQDALAKYFPVGAAMDTADLSGPHAQLLTMHFNSIISGNDMKWSSVEATKGTFNFGRADAEVGLAVVQQHAHPRPQPGVGDRRANAVLCNR